MMFYQNHFPQNIHTFGEVPTADHELSYLNYVKLSASVS